MEQPVEDFSEFRSDNCSYTRCGGVVTITLRGLPPSNSLEQEKKQIIDALIAELAPEHPHPERKP